MADSGWEDFKQFANWAYNRATSHPLGRIESTLKTGRPAPRGGKSLSDTLSPISQAYESAKTYIEGPRKRKTTTKFRRYGPAAPKKRARATSKGRK